MRRYRRYNLLFWSTTFGILFCHLIYAGHFFGWTFFNEFLLSFDHQLGWLGTIFMGLSLLYIPRKKKIFKIGKVRKWYQIHVAFGLIGCLLILMHAYGDFFGIGGIALLVTWLVMATGIIGHFIYKRLPEEVTHRSLKRKEILKQLDQTNAILKQQAMEVQQLRDLLAHNGDLAQFDDQAKIHLPHPTLAKNLKNIGKLWRDFRKSTHQTKQLASQLRKQTSAELHSLHLREKEELHLLHLENDTRNFLVLNEIYSLWRKIHAPLSHFMWFLVAMHVFAWIYF